MTNFKSGENNLMVKYKFIVFFCHQTEQLTSDSLIRNDDSSIAPWRAVKY